MQAATSTTVRVVPRPHGRWEVRLPGRSEQLTCTTLHEARTVARQLATSDHPCELIVYDAYHRVLLREPARSVVR